MGRIGFSLRTDFEAAIREMLAVCELPGLEMTGLFQHFSVADDTAEENVAYPAEQHALFVRAFHALKAAGREDVYKRQMWMCAKQKAGGSGKGGERNGNDLIRCHCRGRDRCV